MCIELCHSSVRSWIVENSITTTGHAESTVMEMRGGGIRMPWTWHVYLRANHELSDMHIRDILLTL